MRHHDVIEAMYLNGNSTKEISEVVNVSDRQVRNVLRKRDVILDGKRRTGGYKINTEFFRKWTNEMAYILGFIITDGCVYGNTITISQKDLEILNVINSAMDSDYPIRKVPNSYGGYVHTLYIHRKSIVTDLATLGVKPKKLLTVMMPNVPDEYMSHFIRGVIDGDGWIQDRGYVANVTGASESFSLSLCNIFVQRGFNTRLVTQEGRIYRVTVSGKQDVINLADWIYKDCGDLLLRRKYERCYVNRKNAA